MTETPEQRVARLEAELAQAKVEALQKELAEAQAQAGQPPQYPPRGTTPQYPPGTTPQYPPRGTTPQSPPGATPPLADARVHLDQLRQLLQEGRSGGFGVSFGKLSRPAPVDTRLAPAPRPVPFAYRLVTIPFSWWTVFALFMVAVAPIALWIVIPLAAVVVASLTFLLIVGLLLRKAALRHTLLKWGEVANVVNVETLSRGTYYSGTTVQNVRMAQAHGWTVQRQWYSGPVTKTRVEYELRGTRASIVVRGLDYDGGVILADSRDPRRALCVSSFPYDLERDVNGNWTGQVGTRVKVGSLVMIDVLVGWTVAMCWIWGYQAVQLHRLVR